MPSGSDNLSALVVLVTVPTVEVGRKLAHTLVSARLAACVNILPGVTSIYRWKDEVEESSEALLVVKSTTARYPALEEAIRAAHPYEVPEILALPVHTGLESYLGWLLSSVG
jgi:periplasmic divalent cation tolerance protein